MDLAELKFVVNTEDLERAAKEVANLGTEVSKLNKPMQELTRESAKTNKELSKAEEAAAKAALAQSKLEQAQTKSVQAAAKSSSVLERQNLILEYMAQGNSKGQASILATAKAAGALDDEMLQLNKTLVTQRTLIGGDPFDKSIGLMQKLQNEFKTTTEVTNLFNKNLGLTEKQMTDLAREKERLIALYGIEGKSLNGLSAEYEQLIQKSVRINQANSERTNIMKAQIKVQDDTVKANAYLATEMERVNRLTESGGAITSTVNNKLIKFEQALKQSGQTAAQQVVALEKYKASLMSIQKAGGDRQVDYLSRALGPQITDIAVGLATGQAPLTILLQQGGQLRDQFALAGVAGAEMGNMLIQASKSMVSSIKDVGVAIGQVLVGAITGTGKSIVNFGMQITGTSALLDIFNAKLVAVAGANSLLVKTFSVLATMLASTVGLAVIATIGSIVALGVAFFKASKEQDAMTRQLALTGGSLAMTTSSAVDMAKSMNQVGVSTSAAMSVITAMAKEGGFVAKEISMVTTAALQMQKYASIAIEDTVKAFSKMKEKPVEALLELAKATGMVSPEITKMVMELVEQGKTTEAIALAMKTLANVNAQQVARMKEDYTGLSLALIEAGSAIKTFFERNFKDLFFKLSPEKQLQEQIDAVDDILKGKAGVFGIGSLFADKEKYQGIREELVAQLDLLRRTADFEKTRTEQNIKLNSDLAKFNAAQDTFATNKDKREKEILETTKRNQRLIEAGLITQQQHEEQILKIREKYQDKKATPERAIVVPLSRDIAIIQKDYNEQLRLAEGFAKDERSILKARFDAGIIDRAEFIARDTELLARSEQQQLNVVESFRGKYKTAYEEQAKALNAAFGNTKDEENRRVLRTAIENLDKDFKEFNSTLDDTKVKIASAFGAREQVALLEFQKAAFESTKTFREYAKAQQDATVNRRIDAEVQSRLLTAYGAEAVKIKAVADETKRQTVEISKFTIAQQRAFEAFQNTLNDPNATGATRGAAYSAYITAMENANKAISISRVSIENAGTDAVVAYYKQEYQRISNGVTDSIVTALFEGGKAGSKQLRNLIIAELKKPITIVVKALVDATLGSFISSLIGGGSGGSFAGSAAGSVATGGISNIAIGGATLGAQAGAFGQGVASGFSLGAPVSSMGGATSASFNMGATYGAPAAGVLAGVYGGRAISGGYSAFGGQSGNSAVNTGTAIGAAVGSIIPGIGTAIGAALGGLLGGATNRLFGRKLTDVGIRGTLGGETGFEGERYTFEKGGTFRKSRTRTSILEEADRSAIASDFRLIKGSVMDLAETAGFGSDAIKNFTTSFQVNLKDLSPEQAVKKYQEEFAKVEEAMAAAVIGSSGYRRENETNIQTLSRLSTFMGGINSAFKKLGFETYKLELASIDAAQSFVDLFGGIEGFNKATTFFYENFFSVEERMANLATDLTTEFDKLGLALPTTREAFRELVTTAKEVGDNALVKNLLDLQYGFADLVPATEAVAEVVDNLTGSSINYARSLLEAQRIQAGAGAYSMNDLMYQYAVPEYSNSSLSSNIASISPFNVANQVSTNNESLIEAVNSVKDEIAELRYEVQADVIHNAKTATILTRVVPDGQSLNVTAAIDGGVV